MLVFGLFSWRVEFRQRTQLLRTTIRVLRQVTGKSYSSHIGGIPRKLTIGCNGAAIREHTMDLIIFLVWILVAGGSGGGGH
jgi:hypothetical protein